jgi:glycosyltransferase involved in cell wall biosynthesis
VERVRLGYNARQRAVDLYSWEQYTRKLEEIYLDVLENAASKSPVIETS